jgi:transcriptional regulator with XRE-family HTH domain
MPTQNGEPPPLGRRLVLLRQRLYLTQRELADRAGLSPAIVQSLEQGQRLDPRVSTVLKLAQALGVSIGELIEEPAPTTDGPAGDG